MTWDRRVRGEVTAYSRWFTRAGDRPDTGSRTASLDNAERLARSYVPADAEITTVSYHRCTFDHDPLCQRDYARVSWVVNAPEPNGT